MESWVWSWCQAEAEPRAGWRLLQVWSCRRGCRGRRWGPAAQAGSPAPHSPQHPVIWGNRRRGLVLPPSLWTLHPKGLIPRVLQGASLHLTGGFDLAKTLACPHPPSSSSPSLAPPARRGAHVQGEGQPRAGSAPGRIQWHLPGREAGRGCQRVSGSREGERALCAAEPGTGLRRDRGRNAGLGASTPTFLYWPGGDRHTAGWGTWRVPCPAPWHGAGTGVQVLARTLQLGRGTATHPAAPGPAWQVPGCPVPTSHPQNDASPLLLFYSESRCKLLCPGPYTEFLVSFFCFLSPLQQPVPAQSTPGCLQSFY